MQIFFIIKILSYTSKLMEVTKLIEFILAQVIKPKEVHFDPEDKS